MTQSSTKNRIIFIDIMRAIAVFQMVQGHTIDAFLSNNYRIQDNPIFGAWLFMRGVTAPIFLFSAGAVFTYLFRLHDQHFE
ncbi:MAG: heparan-alpha-glucosaminide N-acetyltransferase domain-containing protein, partial [Ignavibacteriaceae bacterium]|nr:heparan-alpha-glucosaminide N-acetyltransferase domain-containing protein [Ignavibacteriaceae bacterium]